MNSRYESSPREVERMNTTELRENFLQEKLFTENQVELLYSHYDRLILGGVMPTSEAVALPNDEDLRATFFLERREIGIINVGGRGTVTTADESFTLDNLGCVYLGKGTSDVTFSSADANAPAKFFLLSAPAHKPIPTATLPKKMPLR